MQYELNNNVATLTFDDGKANAVGHQFLDDINAGLDRADAEEVGAVILRGREGMFSGGFDLEEVKKGPQERKALARRGFELLIRLYGFPRPLVAASAGHGIGMGAFIIMACDTRISSRGDFKMRLPETAIGMDLPPLLVEFAASIIAKKHLTRVALQAVPYDPELAVEAGFIDEVVEANALDAHSTGVAELLAQLPQAKYAANKKAIRARTLQAMTDSLEVLVASQ
jgi:enoyl-CoA hydratase